MRLIVVEDRPLTDNAIQQGLTEETVRDLGYVVR